MPNPCTDPSSQTCPTQIPTREHQGPLENLDPSTQCTHKMTTNSMNKIYKPKQFHTVTKHPLLVPIEPTCVSQAVLQPHWCDTMSQELNAMQHGTWDATQWAVNGYS